jgi:two-component system, NarL family, sensor histidine kinase UhpB
LKLRRIKTTGNKNHFDADEIGDTINELIDRISGIYDSSRNILRMLRPEVMDSLGLIGATEDRIDMFTSSQPDCRISLDYDGDFSVLDYHFSIALFRIIQESLTNASKHAQATEIKIRLAMKCEAYPSGVYLCISDNGIGFDTQTRTDSGIGLISMRERAFALNGELKVESVPGKGTHIIANIPFDL